MTSQPNAFSFRWPDEKKCAFVITVGFEAELSVLATAPDAAERAKSLSVGQYGGIRGVDRLLTELDRAGSIASWFIPAANLPKYRRQVESVVAGGHEICNMGWALEDLGLLSLDEQVGCVDRAQELFMELMGVRPVGFRAGRGSCAAGLPQALQNRGFLWTSSWHGDDLPHFHAGSAADLVEVPRHHELDDYPYFVFNLDPPIPIGSPRIASSKEVLRNWILEFDAYRAEGLCFVLTIHPEIIATPGRISLLREFLDYVHAYDDVWHGTGTDVAKWWSHNGPGNAPDHPTEIFNAIINESGV